MVHLKNPITRSNLIVISCFWVASNFGYYLIMFNMKHLAGNIFTNTIFCSTADVLGYFTTGIIFQYVGGKKSILASFSIAGLSGMGALYFKSRPDLISFFLFGCRLGVAAACNVVTILNLTVFPSDFMSTSFGICNIFARLSSILAPIIAELDDPLPFLVFCVVTSSCVFLAKFMQESSNGDDNGERYDDKWDE